MTIEPLCADNVSRQVADAILGVKARNPTVTGYYVACLQVADDFSGMTLFLNTLEHLEKQGNHLALKWEWNSFWSEGIPLDPAPLVESIGEVRDFDEEPEKDVGPQWLATITAAMIQVRKMGGFTIDDCEMFAFCSLSDSDHSPWLEYETAKLLNPQPHFQQFVADYSTVCGGDGYDVAEFKTVPYYRAYKKLLKTLKEE